MGDPFDPHRLIEGDGDDATKKLWSLVADGMLTAENLHELDSFAATLRALGALDPPTLRAALLASVVRERRHRGMTDDQFRDWMARDAHLGD